MQKQKNQKQIVYADVAIHDMPEKVSYKAKENRKIKNSILVDLFYNDENAEENDIALYNALHEEPLPEGTVIQKMRVENALYLNFQNDICFDRTSVNDQPEYAAQESSVYWQDI